MAHAPTIDALIGTQTWARGFDAAIAALASRQHGIVTRSQLLAVGLTPRAVTVRLERRRLHAVHRGVYAVGHESLPARAPLIAAVFACGEAAALSHRTAGADWQIRQSAGRPIEVTVPRFRRRPGIHVHEAPVPADERTILDGIPITTVPRTLLDLAAVLPPEQLERAIERAEALHLRDPLSLLDLLERYPRRRGAAALRSILGAERRAETVTRSELEDAFLTFVARSKLPPPQAVNGAMRVGGRWLQPDFLWREQRLVVELDGYATHGTRRAFESDRSRDRILQAAGLRVVRVTWRHLHQDAAALAADLRALLSPTSLPAPTAAGRRARPSP